MNINELKREMDSLNYQIKKILRDSGYDKWNELDVEYRNDPEEILLLNEMNCCIAALDEVSRKLNYLNRPIKTEGILRKNDNGRYEIGDYELTCGSSVEVLVFEECFERYQWVAASIEHNGEDYYFTGKRDWNLDGSKARIR